MLLNESSRWAVVLGFALSVIVTTPARGADDPEAEDPAALLSQDELEELGTEAPVTAALPERAPILTGSVFLGQSFISNNDAGTRAYPYTSLRPGIVGGGSLSRLGKHYTFDLEGNYLSDRDKQASLAVDFSGHYRFLLQTETFYHNLMGQDFNWNTLTISNGNTVTYSPPPGAEAPQYGLKIRQDKVSVRAKPTDSPFHIDLGYRQFSREGTSQLRFADVQFAAPNSTVYNRPRTIDQTIYEGSAGIDAHLGYIDLVNQFQIRHFVDNNSIPRMVNFQPVSDTNGPLRNGGLLQHNETPDSRFWSNTLRVHTVLSGGLVGALSYTCGQQISFSQLTDISDVSDNTTTIRNMAGDITYTPRPEFSASLKYRRTITEHDAPDLVVRLPSGGSPNASGDSIPTPPPTDSRLDSLATTLLYRPLPVLVLKGEFKGDFYRRQSDALGTTLPGLNDHHEDRYQGKAAIIATPLKGLRIKGQYGYTAITNPLYATTYDERHVGDLVATYNRANAFGLSFSGKHMRESADSNHGTQTSLTTAGWMNPMPMLTLNVSFAYLQSDSDRTIVYRPDTTPAFQAPARYMAQSHIYGVSAQLHPSESLDISASYQQVRSSSNFSPLSPTSFNGTTGNPPVAVTASTDGISDISRTHDVEDEVSARLDYRFTSSLQTTVEYLYRVVHDRVDTSLNGGAHQIVATLGYKW